MDNIVFKKEWNDSDMMELHIQAESEFVKALQDCYIQEADLKEIGQKIISYSTDTDNDNELYVEFGEKEGNFTPAFSMKFSRADTSGHVKIEVDIEIADNSERLHRCRYYVNGELGAIENMGKGLVYLGTADIGTICSLYQNY